MSVDPAITAPREASRRRLRYPLLLLAALAVAGLLWRHQAELPAYRGLLFGGHPAVSPRFEAMSSVVDEAALRQHFGALPWRCEAGRSPDDPSADRICRADIGRADGLPAMALTASLREGRVLGVSVLLPWWAHHAALRALVSRFGAPETIDRTAEPGAAVQWRLPGGWLGLDRRPGFDPLATSRLRWRAEPRPAPPLPP